MHEMLKQGGEVVSVHGQQRRAMRMGLKAAHGERDLLCRRPERR